MVSTVSTPTPPRKALCSEKHTMNECGIHDDAHPLQSDRKTPLTPKLCIDLCSGLGGFSSAFRSDNHWKVITVDNNPKFKPDVLADILTLQVPVEWKHADLVLASPPCERFSLGNRMFPKLGIRKALELVGACLEIIAEVRPKNWVLENPKGRLRWFLGNPAQSIKQSDFGGKYAKPTDLWGTVQLPLVRAQMPYEQSRHSYENAGRGCTGYMLLRDPAKRAVIPYGVSLAIKQSVEGSQ